MKSINVKGLVKQIKASKKNMMWSLKDGVHTLTDRYWLVQFREIPKEVQIALYAIFTQFPEEGTHIRYDRFSGSILKGDSIDHAAILDGASKGEKAKDTGFSYDLAGIRTRVFKKNNIFAYVNENLLLAVDEYDGDILVSGRMQPVYFKDANFLALPYRMGNRPEEEILELFTK